MRNQGRWRVLSAQKGQEKEMSRMATVIIRDVPNDVIEHIDAQARAEGQSREGWLRRELAALVHRVRVRDEYVIRFARWSAAGFAGMLVRHKGSSEGSCLVGDKDRIPTDIFNTYFAALNLVERNAPGDRECVIELLAEISDEVREEPYVSHVVRDNQPRMALNEQRLKQHAALQQSEDFNNPSVSEVPRGR
ncbi:MAG: hypothetical protein ACRDHE_02410 [Ktedonobacterales bacterium]